LRRDGFRSQEESRGPRLAPVWRAAAADSTPYHCFADETAIEFPSVDQFVQRVRDGLLGDTGAGVALSTDVLLSSRAASSGTLVTLEVPLRRTCQLCGGRGEVWTEPCGDCYGTGDALVRHPVLFAMPPGVPNGARLSYRVHASSAAPVRVEVRVAVRSAAW
jgi:hypothetical protein